MFLNLGSMFFETIGFQPAEVMVFFIIYGATGTVSLLGALYLLFRRGNALAPDVTPPLSLRRWAASFFGVMALGHVWWVLFLILSGDSHFIHEPFRSRGYVTVGMLDSITLLITITGTMLAMLQDRRRSVWPVFASVLPLVVGWGGLLISPSYWLYQTVVAYLLLLCVLFIVYVALAVRQYGRWLRDNFADLEHKEVWMSYLMSLVFLSLFIFYTIVSEGIGLFYFLHFIEIVLFGFLLWRVETMPTLEDPSSTQPLTTEREVVSAPVYVNIAQMEELLDERCVDTHLFLQHDLTLTQLAAALCTNRSYLSQYFASQNINYNTYINNLRINYFVSRYQEIVATEQPFTAQQLASESGYRSYSTFSLAFKQRMGQSVTAWMRSNGTASSKCEN